MSKKFTKDHEWISLDGDIATVGITAYAQEQLGDVVFVEVPEAGRQVSQGDDAAVVESVKAASEVYAPFERRSGRGAMAPWKPIPNWSISRQTKTAGFSK